MKTIRTISGLRAAVRAWRRAGETVALVPTMGNLHEGHISLVDLARRKAARVIVSVFVNPIQFGPSEDYAAYPRTVEADRRSLARAGADIAFLPSVEEIYPRGQENVTAVTVPGLSRILCGEFRPGHFDGVTSVVARFFNIAQPDVAVFGQKDFQQMVIIRRLCADLQFPVRIVAGPTWRDSDGLALSSRNQYLDAAERAQAPAMYAALTACREKLLAGARRVASLEMAGADALRRAGFRPDYFAVRTAADLAAPGAAARHLVVLAAGRLGRARLIDNVLVDL